MSDTAAENKNSDKTAVATPEKEKPAKEVDVDAEKAEDADEKEEAPSNGDVKKNGKETADKDEKDNKSTESEEAPVENGVAKDGDAVTTKRKSEAADVADGKVDGVSPEKKAKLEEKVENGEAEATA